MICKAFQRWPGVFEEQLPLHKEDVENYVAFGWARMCCFVLILAPPKTPKKIEASFGQRTAVENHKRLQKIEEVFAQIN